MIQKDDFLKQFDELAAKQEPLNFFWYEKNKGNIAPKKGIISGPVTISFSPPKPAKMNMVDIGDRIMIKSGGPLQYLIRIKNKRFVYRLLRKPGKFIPYFEVTSICDTGAEFRFTSKPYNF